MRVFQSESGSYSVEAEQIIEKRVLRDQKHSWIPYKEKNQPIFMLKQIGPKFTMLKTYGYLNQLIGSRVLKKILFH